jgi:preprotein translocase subunit SecG
MAFVRILLWIVFAASAVLLAVLVLLQEGKGGGLAEAFGGAGAETFGVKSGGVNKVTFVLFSVYLASAILLHSTWGADAVE